MGKKKSAAQLRRLQKRSSERGDTPYLTDPPTTDHPTPSQSQSNDPPTLLPQDDDLDSTQSKRMTAAHQLHTSLSHMEANSTKLNAKERRSAKRKAEAIAKEESGCQDIDELMSYYHAHKDQCSDLVVKEIPPTEVEPYSSTITNKTERTKKETRKKNPYILFVGQLSYSTTKQALFDHFKNHVSEGITPETLTIRLMNVQNEYKEFEENDTTEPNLRKTNTKSTKGGYAFAEFTTPTIMYKCLKLHQTELDGRRINIYRGASNRAHSKSRQVKITQRRHEQETYVAHAVTKIVQEYMDAGQLSNEELDEGVIALLKRRSADVVNHALREYIDKRDGRNESLENPSAFLTAIVCEMSQEPTSSKMSYAHTNTSRGKDRERGKGRETYTSNRGYRTSQTNQSAKDDYSYYGIQNNDSHDTVLSRMSIFSKEGVDMSASERDTNVSNDFQNRMDRIFPSWLRGRGRGRNYVY